MESDYLFYEVFLREEVDEEFLDEATEGVEAWFGLIESGEESEFEVKRVEMAGHFARMLGDTGLSQHIFNQVYGVLKIIGGNYKWKYRHLKKYNPLVNFFDEGSLVKDKGIRYIMSRVYVNDEEDDRYMVCALMQDLLSSGIEELKEIWKTLLVVMLRNPRVRVTIGRNAMREEGDLGEYCPKNEMISVLFDMDNKNISIRKVHETLVHELGHLLIGKVMGQFSAEGFRSRKVMRVFRKLLWTEIEEVLRRLCGMNGVNDRRI